MYRRAFVDSLKNYSFNYYAGKGYNPWCKSREYGEVEGEGRAVEVKVSGQGMFEKVSDSGE